MVVEVVSVLGAFYGMCGIRKRMSGSVLFLPPPPHNHDDDHHLLGSSSSSSSSSSRDDDFQFWRPLKMHSAEIIHIFSTLS